MHSRRSTHELCAIDNYIFAVGGNDGSSSLNSVEVRNYARFENNAHEFMMLSNDLTFSYFSSLVSIENIEFRPVSKILKKKCFFSGMILV